MIHFDNRHIYLDVHLIQFQLSLADLNKVDLAVYYSQCADTLRWRKTNTLAPLWNLLSVIWLATDVSYRHKTDVHRQKARVSQPS